MIKKIRRAPYKKLVFFLCLILGGLILASPALAGGCIPDDVRNVRLDEVLFCVLEEVASALVLIAPGVAVIFIAYGGISYMSATSSGNPRKIESAKRVITLALIGGVVAMGAAGILQAVLKFLGQ